MPPPRSASDVRCCLPPHMRSPDANSLFRTTAMTDGSAITERALRLIQNQRTLVLATADPEPWAAPVYYVYGRRRFYFFSGENSRHVTAALATDRCATSIYRDGDDWRDIEGLQMDGRLESIPLGAEALGIFRAYVKKFPTVREFFVEAVFDFQLFTQRFRTQLYAFVPQRVFYLSNQAGLGSRREIQLPEGHDGMAPSVER